MSGDENTRGERRETVCTPSALQVLSLHTH
jgi:hypothetical protein